jgi:cation:H+ antiporter
MLWLIVQFVLLASVVVAAGIVLTRCADHLADATGLGKTLVGVVLLAGATSLPEMSVGFTAVRMGAIDLTAGDLFGSSLCNLMILAVVDLATRNRTPLLGRQAAAHALSATACIVLKCIVLFGILAKQTIELGPVSGSSLALIAVYFLILRLVYFDELAARRELPSPEAGHRPKLLPNLTGFGLAAVVILLVAPRLAHVADELAQISGLGRTFMGTVFVAAVTSLPEVVASYTAVRLGSTELAVGNVFGSNAFNMLVLGMLDFAQPGPLLAQISETHAVTVVAGILITAVATLTLLYRAERRWLFIEPDAVLIASLVVGAMALVYWQSR